MINLSFIQFICFLLILTMTFFVTFKYQTDQHVKNKSYWILFLKLTPFFYGGLFILLASNLDDKYLEKLNDNTLSLAIVIVLSIYLLFDNIRSNVKKNQLARK